MTNFDFYQLQRGSVIQFADGTHFVLWRRGKSIKTINYQSYLVNKVKFTSPNTFTQDIVKEIEWNAQNYTRVEFVKLSGKIYNVIY